MINSRLRLALALLASALLHVGLLELKIGVQGGDRVPPAVLQVRFDMPPPLPTEATGLQTPLPTPPAKEQPALPKKGMLPEVPVETSRYYFSSEVDVRAEPLQMQPLIYPAQAYRMRLYGKVKLRVYVNEEGNIDSVDVVEATPPGVFEAAALKALLSGKFSPAEKDGHKVKNQKLVEINFDPYENIDGLPDK